MVQKKEITLTIDGKEVRGKEGDTILDICCANDIYVPTLCHLEGLSSVGACRLCVVEIEGERRINPACTYPARDGLVVRTNTEKLEKYRRQILELLFTERNHFCFFCAASGDCELQNLAYRYQMDHARYPYTFPSLPTDTLNDFLVLDHNRCILCGRCVRICSEAVGNRTLSFSKRGRHTVITADLSQSIGESSCISCGACIQACPTGAIFSKLSAYRGRTTEGQTIHSICSLCGVGCEIDVLVKDNNIVRIDGTNLTGPRGHLCVRGRFHQLYKEAPRITTPIITDADGTVRVSSWEEALNFVTRIIRAYRRNWGVSSIAGLVSSLCPNETVAAFSGLMRDTVGTNSVSTLDGTAYRTLADGVKSFTNNGQGLAVESPLEAILDADCVLVVGVNPLESHPVAGCYILRALVQNRAQLLVIDSAHNDLSLRSDLWLRPADDTMGALIKALAGLVAEKGKRTKQPQKVVSAAEAARASGIDEALLAQAADLLSSAKEVVVVYGERIYNRKAPELVADVLQLAQLANPDGLKVISLKPRGNSRGAWELLGAPESEMAEVGPKLVYILLADDEYGAEDWMPLAEQAEFLVVQASYASPLTKAADVVLPSPTWAERSGEYISLDGKVGHSQPVLEPPLGIRSDVEVITQLAEKLKRGRPAPWRR